IDRALLLQLPHDVLVAFYIIHIDKWLLVSTKIQVLYKKIKYIIVSIHFILYFTIFRFVFVLFSFIFETSYIFQFITLLCTIPLMDKPLLNRDNALREAATSSHWDIAVIGGGATGLGIA